MKERVIEIMRKADAVCFDVDSTVIREEGIDELAKFCKKGKEVMELTAKAMTGTMTFQEAMELRLNIIRPSMGQIRDFIQQSPPTLSPGIKELVNTLHSRNVPVYLISGGFRSMILPVANKINISPEKVFCNRLMFYYNGEYAGFDTKQPTSRSGGKSVVINQLKEKHGYKNLILIGDGATDLEASPPADGFIGYGGNIIRANVQANSKWFVTDFNEIINVLND